jgi:hypothetical protein
MTNKEKRQFLKSLLDPLYRRQLKINIQIELRDATGEELTLLLEQMRQLELLEDQIAAI